MDKVRKFKHTPEGLVEMPPPTEEEMKEIIRQRDEIFDENYNDRKIMEIAKKNNPNEP